MNLQQASRFPEVRQERRPLGLERDVPRHSIHARSRFLRGWHGQQDGIGRFEPVREDILRYRSPILHHRDVHQKQRPGQYPGVGVRFRWLRYVARDQNSNLMPWASGSESE